MIGAMLSVVSLAVLLTLSVEGAVLAQTTNPCGAKNPCAANPCAAENPCAAAKLDPQLITRPAGTKLASGKSTELVSMGERLWKDSTLSTSGVSCQTCHQGNANFNATFAKAYPHPVAMAKDRAGLRQIDADEMVQMCMVVPMAAKPLPWDSRQLAALTAYVKQLQKAFEPPTAMANPCAAKNPCGANPCAATNPCGANPCAANPCAAKKN